MKPYKHILLIFLFVSLLSCEDEDAFQFDESNVSSAGSLARFHIDQNYLYVAESNALTIFDITNYDQVEKITKLIISNEVETIFRLDTILYLGTTTGVLFYDISTPSSPKIISTYEHLTSCDPVVANGLFAFATLRSGNNCGNGGDFLDIIDISDITDPKKIASYTMKSPYGLGLMGSNLFIGEKYNGMRWFDVSDVNNIVEMGYFPTIHAIDFIVKENKLTISTTVSLLQMELTASNELIVLSELLYAQN